MTKLLFWGPSGHHRGYRSKWTLGQADFEGLEIVASEGMSLYAPLCAVLSQVMSWKEIPSMPAHDIPVSARLATACVAGYLVAASAHSLPAIPGWDLTLNRRTGFGELLAGCMSIIKIYPQACTWWQWIAGYSKCFLLDKETRGRQCEWLWRMVAVIAASSALLMVFVMPMPFGSAKRV